MHTRMRFEQALEALSNSLIIMGAHATDAVGKAIDALGTDDSQLAQKVIDRDGHIDEMERAIEQQCLSLLLCQQPVASDLRKVSTAIKMITDIERVGDCAADIAEIILYHCAQKAKSVLPDIRRMAKTAQRMVDDAIRAYVNEDLALAAQVIAMDDTVDEAFNRIKLDLAQGIIDGVHSVDSAMDCLMIIKYIERLGDHAVNIGEWVQFYKTGVHKNERIL